MATEKILRIRVVADTGTTEQGFNKLSRAAAAAGVSISSYKTFLDDASGKTTHFVNVTGESVAKLDSLRKALADVYNKRNQSLDADLIKSDPLKDQRRRQSELSRAYANESRIALSALNDRLALEQARRLHGADSVKALQVKAAQDEKAIREALANNLKTIEEDIKNGVITRVRDAEQARVRAIRDAARDITNIRKAQEAEANKVTKRNNSANVYKEETAKIVSELDRRLAMEHSKRVYGADHIRTIELKAAQDEVSIRERMAAKLLDIEQRLRAGTIANRGAANMLRAGALNQGATEINAIRDALHAAQAQDRHNRSLEEAARAHKNLFIHIAELVGMYRVANAAINYFLSALKAIPKIGIELESTQASLTATTGSTAGLASVMKFLDAEARRTGIAVGTLRETFRGFQASTSLAGESLQTTVNIFRDINTVVTSLHLPAEKASGIFNALAQIFNKSKVQSEELVKQLGNLIPGAFAAFAAANKSQFANSTVLIEEMKKGTVFAHETVENFAAFLANRFAASFDIASQGLNANIGRLKTSFTHLGEAIYGVASGALSFITKGLTSFADYLTESVTGTTNLTVAVNALSQALLVLGGSALLKVVDKALLASSTIAATTGFMARLSGVGYLAIAALDKLKLAFAFLINPYTIVAGLGLIAWNFSNLQQKANDAAKSVAEGSKKMIETLKQLKERPREEVLLDLKFNVSEDANVKAVREQIEAEKRTIEDLSETQVGLFNFSNVGAMKAALERVQLLKESKARLQELNEVEKEAVKIAEDKLKIQNAEQRTLVNLTGVNPASTLREQQLKELSFTDPAAYARENYLHVASSDIKGLADKIEQYPKDIVILREEIARLTEVAASATGAQLDEANIALETQKSRLEEAQDLLTKSIDSINLIYSNAEKAGERAQTKLDKKTSTVSKATRDIYKDLVRDSKAATQEMESDIRRLGYTYEDNVISIEEYFAKKRALQEADIGRQVEYIYKQQDLARAANDSSKLEQLDDAKRDLFAAAGVREEQDLRAKVVILKEYKEHLLDIQASALEARGNTAEANALRINQKYLEEEKRLRANNSKEALKQLDISKKFELAMTNMDALERQSARNTDLLRDKEDSLNVARNAGLTTESESLRNILAARREYIDQQEEILANIEAIAAANKDNPELQDRARQVRSSLDAVKYEGIDFNKNFLTPDYKSTYDDNKINIEQSREASILKANADYKKALLVDELKAKEEHTKALLDIDKKYSRASTANALGMFSGMLSVGSDTFMGLTQAAVKMYGENSKQAKAAFALYKATKIGEIAMSTAAAVMTQLTAGPYIGWVMAGMAAALGAAQIAMVAAQPMPAAHGGLDYVPKEQTYLLDKGERVLSPRQNSDLTSFLQQRNMGENKETTVVQQQQPNIRIINAVDPSVFSEYLGSDEGEKVVMNIVRRNEAR